MMSLVKLIAGLLLFALTAAAEDSPRLVFFRPPDCSQRCAVFDAAVAHPAMQRRLATVRLAFETREVAPGEKPGLALFHPAEREVMRWTALPDWLMLADIVTLVDLARPHLIEAASTRDSFVAERERALALLALGDSVRGGELLREMRRSGSAENRQLASIWLERLSKSPREEILLQQTKKAGTPRVEVEAWMALGDVRLEKNRFSGAIDAYDHAARVAAPRSFSRQNALDSRQRAIALAVPVLGVPADGSMVSGRKTVRPRSMPKGVAKVEFRLDGKRVALVTRRPFAAGVDFGRVPLRHTLEVVLRNRAGKVLDRASMTVNERADAFAVDIVSPSQWIMSGPIDVALEARVPSDRSIDELVVEWNGTPVAHFTTPPYRAHVELPESYGVLRAVLRLDDGSEAEDALLPGLPSLEAEAHLVEVPVYFDTDTPSVDDVVVREAGRERAVERVIRPKDAPLQIALLIDSSSSMKEHMLDVQEGAVRFLERHLGERDAAVVMGFNHSARLLRRPGRDRAVLERTILNLRPRGGTALYDAIITALLQLQSNGSRRAVVVFTDGFDANSVASADDVSEVARRTGVPVYVLTLTPKDVIPAEELVAKASLEAITTESGGAFVAMSSLEKLDAFFAEIGADLSRQSLVIYRTGSEGAEWRPLELLVRGRKSTRAPSGVYVMPDGR
jgi:VWFA-related protein